jgi:Na+/H+ antiporter NhaC
MARAERRALTTGQIYDESQSGAADDDFKVLVVSEKGKASDLVIPVIVLFAASIFFMIYTGGYFDGGLTIGESFYETDAATSLIYGTFLSILVGITIYKVRGSVTISDSMKAFVVGMKSMFFAVVLLTMAWSIGGISEALGTGEYLVSLIGDSVGGGIIPFAIFLLACFIAFSTGSSWGTFAIMLPIAIPLAHATGADMSASIAAVLAGGVFGDHCSPLADTTILSSTGAACNHLDHVRTQLPYAVTVAFSSGIGFLLAGYMHSPLIPFLVAGAVFVASLLLLNKFFGIDVHKALPGVDVEELEQQKA